MPLGLEPARQVHRQGAIAVDRALLQRAGALPLRRQTHCLIGQQFGDGEAIMHLGKLQIAERDPGFVIGHAERPFRPLEGQEIPRGHRKEVADMNRGAEAGDLGEAGGILFGGQHDRSGAVGDQRAVGQAQRRRDLGILIGDLAGLFKGEPPLHLGQRVVHGVVVVLDRDPRHRVQRTAMAISILARGKAEDLRKAEAALGLVVLVAGPRQGRCHVFRGAMRHLLGAHHQHGPGLASLQRVDAGMDRRRPRGAGILSAHRRGEAQLRKGLKDQRRGEAVGDEARVEMPQKHRVDIAGRDAGLGYRFPRDLDDQLFKALVQPPELAVARPDDADGPGHVAYASLSVWLRPAIRRSGV